MRVLPITVAVAVLIATLVLPKWRDETSAERGEVVAADEHASALPPEPVTTARSAEGSDEVAKRGLSVSPAYRSSLFRDTATGARLQARFVTFEQVGEHAAVHYEEAMAGARADPHAVSELHAYGQLGHEPSEDRYKIPFTLTELASPEALPLVVDVATAATEGSA